MSIRAMNWAMAARTDGVSAQCVLFVVADTANENGVSIHADPDYIAERTRQSRATVFRRLNELESAGALTRLKRYRDDGAPVYEVRLHLDREIDYTRPDGSSDDPQDIEPKSQIETPPESQSATPKVAPVRQAESQSCDSKSPSKNPEEPPNPPLGGVQAVVPDGFERFQATWGFPITDLPKAMTVWSVLTAAEREGAITGALGYRSYIEGERKAGRNRAVKDAHRWLRDKLWLGYLTAGKSAEAQAERFNAREASDEWRAWTVFYRCCGQSGIPPFMISAADGARVANLPKQWPPVGREFIDGDSDDWQEAAEGTGEFAAWIRRLRELPTVGIGLRSKIIDGRSKQILTVPARWPPARGSPSPPLATESDLQELADETR